MAKKLPQTDSDIALKALDLLQELIWAIRSRESSELLNGVAYLRNLTMFDKKGDSPKNKSTRRDTKGNLKALVGAMPIILGDLELFPTNEDIAKFAVEALQIHISRWEKRSRYEMIGMLVMESMDASDVILQGVGKFLSKLSEEAESMSQIKAKSRQTGFSWNEAIRSLSTTVE